MSDPTITMSTALASPATRETMLMAQLFLDPALNVYAILDGASIPELLNRLKEDGPESACLYRGEMPADLAACAPYLVALKREDAFTRWLLGGFGQHWGVFVQSAADLRTLRQHFRTFLLVHDADGKTLYFRYYDPRVLRRYLPTCNEGELATVFGPVLRYFAESDKADQLLGFAVRDGKLIHEIHPQPTQNCAPQA